MQVYAEGAAAEAAAKGSWGSGLGEAKFSWVPIVTGLRELAESMDAEAQPKPVSIDLRADGRLVATLAPQGLEKVVFEGFRGELWLEPHKPATQGKLYRDKAAGNPGPGGIALVLGAGNQISVAALDILHKLFLEDQVVVCKMNPVNEYMGPYIRRAFAPLVENGYMEVVYGGAEQGKFLCEHSLVTSIHLTGYAQTYDAIVWGPGQSKTGKPKLNKEVTAELGCVTPYIVVPGQWSPEALKYHADVIVMGLTGNAGHNCLAAEIVVTAKDWPQRDAFLQALRERLDVEVQRWAYYPGSEQKYEAFRRKFGSKAEAHGSSKVARLEGVKASPWLLVADLSPEQADTKNENWCGVLQEVALPNTGTDGAAFLEKAVEFANERCWGSLGCSIIIPPDVKEQHPQAVDAAIANLRYGSIVVNGPVAMGFAFTRLTWGAYPGNSPQDIGSGNCAVHNTMLFDHPQKSVVWAPWTQPLAAPMSAMNRNPEGIADAVMRFMAAPSGWTIAAAAFQSLLG
jgi:hypothetical protein